MAPSVRHTVQLTQEIAIGYRLSILARRHEQALRLISPTSSRQRSAQGAVLTTS